MVTATFQDESGVFWVGSIDGISKVDLASGGFHRISRSSAHAKLEDDFVTSITGDAKGRIYFGTKNNGVAIWDRKSDIFKILKDHDKEGFSRYRNHIRTINIDQRGKVWVTTPLGLASYNEVQGKFVEHKSNSNEPQIIDTVRSISDRNGKFWFTSRRGIFKFDPETKRTYQILPFKEGILFEGFESTHLVAEDSSGNILFTTDRGIQKIAPSDTTYEINDGSYNQFYSRLIGRINAFIEDHNQQFWVATDLRLFFTRLNTKNVEIAIERGFTDKKTIGIDIDVNPKKQERTPTYSNIFNTTLPPIYDDFIPLDAKIFALVQDRKENIWLSTSKGIAKLDKKNSTLKYYPQSIEQQSENFSANVIFVDDANTIYLAGPNGITYFNPDNLFENTIPPRITIRSFSSVDNRSGLNKVNNFTSRNTFGSEDKAIHVPYDQSSVSIEYTALHFANSRGNKYRYMLEGIDRDWKVVDSRKSNVQYPNLKPGHYKFRVMAASAYGIWSNEASMLFIVAKPYWETMEFAVAAIFIFMVLTSYAHNRKIRRHQKAKSQLEAQIQERTLEIATQNRNKSKFIADAAHDLRQPIHAIGNLLEATKFALEKNDQEKSLALLQQTKMAVTLMSSTFNAILELSRLETGLILPTYTSVDLSQLLSEINNTLSGLGVEKKVSLKLAFNRGKAYIVRSDKILLTRVLTNLISNAIKYSNPSRAKVILRLAIIQNRCRVYILDNGIGMSEDNLPKIFQPFYQINNPEHDRERGLGLGLSIVSAAISLLDNHSIDVCSIPHKGTLFYLDLPQTLPIDLRAEQLTHIRKSDFPKIDGLYIIYVEDDSLVRTSTEILLRELGVLVSSFKSGEDLFEDLKEIERCPDLILTDHNLPNNVTSDEIIFAIRDEFDSPIPAIIISGEYMDENFGMQRSANVLLRKPVSPSELAYCIEKISKTSVSNLDGTS
jgi:signal transduction histidine kinase/CheY-like chemotaxis protein